MPAFPADTIECIRIDVSVIVVLPVEIGIVTRVEPPSALVTFCTIGPGAPVVVIVLCGKLLSVVTRKRVISSTSDVIVGNC